MTIKEHGLDRFGRLIDRNIAQAQELAQLIAAEPELELLAPVRTNIVCFRYNAGGRDTAALNALNQELLIRLHESGVAAPSYTTLGERYCLRAAITNFRTTSEDLPVLVRAVKELGRTLTAR
jgi:glutamate/tyrosine decarboxylase-like PLP-dependent enzyme